jgi:hypothetical protein
MPAHQKRAKGIFQRQADRNACQQADQRRGSPGDEIDLPNRLRLRAWKYIGSSGVQREAAAWI